MPADRRLDLNAENAATARFGAAVDQSDPGVVSHRPLRRHRLARPSCRSTSRQRENRKRSEPPYPIQNPFLCEIPRQALQAEQKYRYRLPKKPLICRNQTFEITALQCGQRGLTSSLSSLIIISCSPIPQDYEDDSNSIHTTS